MNDPTFLRRAGDLQRRSGAQHIVTHTGFLTHIGRNGARVTEIPLTEVPAPQRERECVTFTVNGLRLDAILSGTFGLSRTAAAERIAAGLVQMNHAPCLKPAAELNPGDVFSLRGSGKAKLIERGGKSRKDRTHVRVEKYR